MEISDLKLIALSIRNTSIKSCQATFNKLLKNASESPHEIARLKAVSSKNASDWLNCLPIPSLGLKLNPTEFKISTAIRLGASVCQPHTCSHCGDDVSKLGRHGLYCRVSAGKSGRITRHYKVNDIIKRAVISAGFPAKLEPSGLYCKDGTRKRPDGYTYESFRFGKPLAWDFTCSDTLAPSHYLKSSKIAGSTAEWAENKKFETYGN